MIISGQKKMVDAIEDGRIVEVSEEYARREGLLILKRQETPSADPVKLQQHMKISPRLRGDRKVYVYIDKYRRPLKIKNNVAASLIDNFHWYVSSKRREVNWSRKQFAEKIGASEADVKMIENGILPSDDFVLINKIEQVFGISLRKDERDTRQASLVKPGVRVAEPEIRAPQKRAGIEESKTESKISENITGDDIEIEF